jgi:hypothetical protein
MIGLFMGTAMHHRKLAAKRDLTWICFRHIGRNFAGLAIHRLRMVPVVGHTGYQVQQNIPASFFLSRDARRRAGQRHMLS